MGDRVFSDTFARLSQSVDDALPQFFKCLKTIEAHLAELGLSCKPLQWTPNPAEPLKWRDDVLSSSYHDDDAASTASMCQPSDKLGPRDDSMQLEDFQQQLNALVSIDIADERMLQ